MTDTFHIGTCSWKYPSWRGPVYSDAPHINYLAEYAQRYDCVEVDQWFWSLYGPEKIVLPQPKAVSQYASSVPDSFRFGIKMPNALTMSHFRPKQKTHLRQGSGGQADPLVPNPHFLSMAVLRAFLERIQPLHGNLGPLMLQFGYLNKKMMPSQAEFLDRLGAFASQLPADYTWCIESRNPNYLNDQYFAFLHEHDLGHVFLHGYYMPSIFPIYREYAGKLTGNVVIRLHGPDREGMEERTGKDWSKIIEPRDADLDAVAGMLADLAVRRRTVWAFVNNHYEGCAPLTIKRIQERLA